jgi:hypothetical protein
MIYEILIVYFSVALITIKEYRDRWKKYLLFQFDTLQNIIPARYKEQSGYLFPQRKQY